MALVISIINMKGGVGKTTLAINLSAALAMEHQKKSLLVDLDPHLSATLSLLSLQKFSRLRQAGRTLSSLLDASSSDEALLLAETFHPVLSLLPGFDLLPGDLGLDDGTVLSRHLRAGDTSVPYQAIWQQHEACFIRDLLAPFQEKYDFILLDCAASYGLPTRSALLASQYYLLPTHPEPLSLVGTQLLQHQLKTLGDRHPNLDDQLSLLGIIFVHTHRHRYGKQVAKRVSDDYPAHQIFQTQIPFDANFTQAADRSSPLVLLKPRSAGAKAIRHLATEFLDKLEVAGALTRSEPS